MSQINLKRFVDIDIVYHTLSTVVSTRETTTLLSTDTLSEAVNKVYSSYEEVATDFVESSDATKAYAKVYFENGGIKLHIISNISDKAAAITAINNLPNEEIVIAYTGAYADAKAIAQERQEDANVYGINQKLILARATVTTDTDVVQNFIVKYSKVQGAEMTIAAYLSQIDVYKDNSIEDYAFTKEILTEEDDDDSVLEACINNNINVDMFLSGAIRNLGGNTKDGYAVTNAYCLIVLHQTITEKLLSVLVEKVKGSEGLAKIGTVIGQELSKYVASGFLATDKTWTDNDLTKSYNGVNYSIIRQGEQLLLGYKVVVLPYNSLTDEDKAKRKTPPIYVVLADAYGIRQITANGEVL